MQNKNILYRYTGDLSQIFYVKPYRLCMGRADNMYAVDVNNGAGIEFTVFPDRAMDIGRFAVRGDNCAFLSKGGEAAPAYYDDKSVGWLKTFAGGFLATCGLTQVGAPCVSDGEELGLHGDIGAVPAEEFYCGVDTDEEIPVILLKGKMRCARAMGRNLIMTREIRVKYGDNKVYLSDRVENRSTKAVPYMILYHMNIGYPMLEPGVCFDTNATYTAAAGDYPDEKLKARLVFPEALEEGEEEVYYYQTVADLKKMSYAGVYNHRLKKGVRIWSRPDQLKYITQWKNPLAGDYVMGVEPCNCRTLGREKQKEFGLEYIAPFESRRQDLIIEIL
jgi:hypothetical protein